MSTALYTPALFTVRWAVEDAANGITIFTGVTKLENALMYGIQRAARGIEVTFSEMVSIIVKPLVT